MKTGRYRHYKGNEYVVIGVARHSETDEELVVYRPNYGGRRVLEYPSLSVDYSSPWFVEVTR